MSELSEIRNEKAPSRLELAGLLGVTAFFTTVASGIGGYTAVAYEKAKTDPENYLDVLLTGNATVILTATTCVLYHVFQKKRELRKRIERKIKLVD